MRFECNCTNEVEFRQMVEECRKEDCGSNFEVGARLWYTLEGADFAIMVEYQITTETCRKLLKEDDEPDWFTAYCVDDENDCDCSSEVWTEAIEDFTLIGLQNAMSDFAKRIYEERIIKEEN